MICKQTTAGQWATASSSQTSPETVRGTVFLSGGQVEQINRTIKEGEAEQEAIRGIFSSLNVKRFHYESHDQLRIHLSDFMVAYNFARRLKTLSGLTLYEYI